MTESQKLKIKFNRLTKAQRILFPSKQGKLDAPTQKGVYIIFDASKQVVHVGCSPRGKWGLYQRLSNHLYGISSFVENYSPLQGNGNKLREKYSYKYLVINGKKNARERILLEAYAIGQLCPKYIGEGRYSK